MNFLINIKKHIFIIPALFIFIFSFTGAANAAIKIPPVLYEAVVMLLAADDSGAYSGSGVIIDSKTGLIVTNDHVVFSDDGVMREVNICYTLNPYSPPSCIATGKILASYQLPVDLSFIVPDKLIDAKTDTVTDTDFNMWLRAAAEKSGFTGGENLYTAFPFANTAVDDGLPELNDDVSILGYPGAGGSTLTVTNGTISGFSTSGKNLQGQSVIDAIKTDASINHGNSGGAAIDKNFRLIGIPSAFDSEKGDIGYIIPIATVASAIENSHKKGQLDKDKISSYAHRMDADQQESEESEPSEVQDTGVTDDAILELIKQAEQAENEKQWKDAIEIYKQILDQENASLVWASLAIAYENDGELDLALDATNKAYETMREDAPAEDKKLITNNLCRALEAFGPDSAENHNAALRVCKENIELEPNNDVSWMRSSLAYEALKDYNNSLEAIKRALTMYPLNASYNHWYGLLLQKTGGQLKEIELPLLFAAEKEPHDKLYSESVVFLYYEKNKYKELKKFLKQIYRNFRERKWLDQWKIYANIHLNAQKSVKTAAANYFKKYKNKILKNKDIEALLVDIELGFLTNNNSINKKLLSKLNVDDSESDIMYLFFKYLDSLLAKKPKDVYLFQISKLIESNPDKASGDIWNFKTLNLVLNKKKISKADRTRISDLQKLLKNELPAGEFEEKYLK